MPLTALALACLAQAPFFVENRGQFDPRARFVARTRDGAVFVTADGFAVTRVRAATDGPGCAGAAVTFACAAPGAAPRATGVEPLPFRVSDFTGRDPARWEAGAPAHARVRLADVAPGVDLELSFARGALEYDLDCASAAALEAVAIRVAGAAGIELRADGALELATAAGPLVQRAPCAYVAAPGGERRAVAARFRTLAADRFGFAVDAAGAASFPLVLDPELTFATYLGSPLADWLKGVEVAPNGNLVVTGQSASAAFPTTPGAFSTGFGGGPVDSFAGVFDPTGAQLLACTFFGGNAEDYPRGFAVDATGAVTIVGRTISPDFPTTAGAFDPTFNGGWEGFALRFTPDLAALDFSTYVGAAGDDYANDVALDGQDAWITGATLSPAFPTAPGAFQPAFGGVEDGYLLRLAADGSSMPYSSFFGGSADEDSGRVARAPSGLVLFGGSTRSPNYPTTLGAFDPTWNGASDAFVSALDPATGQLAFSTYIGGSAHDVGFGLALDGAGAAYFTGYLGSTDFPVTPGAFDVQAGGQDALVAKLAPDGSALEYASYLGGAGAERGADVGVDADGRAVATGFTASADFPVTCAALGPALGGQLDAFLVRVNEGGTALLYSSYLGGGGTDATYALEVASADRVLVTLDTGSVLPASIGSFDPTPNGGQDAMLLAFDLRGGVIAPAGAGCPGSAPAPVLSASGCPVEGATIQLALSGGAPNAPGLLLAGSGGGPVALTPACALSFAPALVLPIQLDAAGALALPAALPAGTGPIAIAIALLIADAGAPAGFAASNGLALEIGG